MGEADTPKKASDAEEDVDIVLETGPIVWPVIAVMTTIVGVGLLAVIVLLNDPNRVGGQELAELLVYAVVLLVAVILLRYGIKLLILRKTRYVIHDEGFKREYSLLYRHKVREVPIGQLRGEEYVQDRYQTIFGCATIRLLTGGTDYSLGFIEFESVKDPTVVFETIQAVRRATVTAR